MSKPQPITTSEFASLKLGSLARILHGHACLEFALRDGHGLFVMRGQTGVHTLDSRATDLDRLNAHWQGFAGHDLNQLG